MVTRTQLMKTETDEHLYLNDPGGRQAAATAGHSSEHIRKRPVLQVEIWSVAHLCVQLLNARCLQVGAALESCVEAVQCQLQARVLQPIIDVKCNLHLAKGMSITLQLAKDSNLQLVQNVNIGL